MNMKQMRYFVFSTCVFLLYSSAGAVTFRNLGPGGGGTPGCLAVDPKNPKIAYVGLDCGGMHVTTDGGKSWRNANTGIEYAKSTGFGAFHSALVLPTGRALTGNEEGRLFVSDDHGKMWKEVLDLHAGVGVIVSDPKDPKTVYAAKREVIFVSHASGDAGSWTALNTDPNRRLPSDADVFSMAIDPVNTNQLYVATSLGLYRSRDGGKNWGRVDSKGLETERPGQIVTVPGRANVLYTVLGSAGVYRSEDAGETFAPAKTGLPEGQTFEALAADPANPDVLYLGSRSWVGGLYRTLDGGKTWTCLYSAEKAPVNTTGSFHPEPSHVSVGWNICVAPGDKDGDGTSDVVYFIGDNVGQVFKTTDGGKTFEQLITDPKVIDGQTFWAGRGDIEFLCTTKIIVDPSNPKHLWVANFDWGVLESVDGGESFRTSLGPWVQNELIGAIRDVVLDPDDLNIAIAASGYSPGSDTGGVLMNYHNQGWWIRGGRQKNTYALPNGSVMGLAIAKWTRDDKPNKYLYAISGVNGVYRVNLLGGENWEKVSTGLGKDDVGRFLACVPNTSTIYLTTTTGVFRSDDGTTWKKIAGDGTKYPVLKECVECLAVDPKNPNRVYASLMKSFREHPDEGIYMSEDRGETWTKIARVPIPYDISLDSSGEKPILYVASQCHGVYKLTQDSEGKWQCEIYGDHRNGLDNTRCWTVTVDPHNPKRLYVGTVGSFVFVGE